MSAPTEDEIEDVLLACRYGDSDDVEAFVAAHGASALASAHDPNGNTALHMASANGHTDLLAYLLTRVPPALLAAQNVAGSTALHWAALNRHLPAAKALIAHPGGPGAALVSVKNTAGRSPLAEAETAGWDEGAAWLVGVMEIEDGEGKEGEAEEIEEVEGGEAQKIEVEIEDADGGIAKMTLGGDAPAPTPPLSGAPS